MSWSSNLYQKIIQSGPGLLINRSKLGKRRVVLFPRDILAEYVRISSHDGSEDAIYAHAKQWSYLFCQARFPPLLKKISPEVIINHFLPHVWKSTGGIESIRLLRKENELIIELKDEILSQRIGPNAFVQGSLAGILEYLYGSRIDRTSANAQGSVHTYSYTLLNDTRMPERPLDASDRTPSPKPTTSADLKWALRTGIITAGPRNTLFFRETPLMLIENTYLHMLGNEKIGMDHISPISTDYFSPLVDSTADLSQRMILLKSLVQSFGWGTPLFYLREEEVRLNIRNAPPPIGGIRPNPLFYLNVIEGFLRTQNDSFRLGKWTQKKEDVEAEFIFDS